MGLAFVSKLLGLAEEVGVAFETQAVSELPDYLYCVEHSGAIYPRTPTLFACPGQVCSAQRGMTALR
jgi:hypothetical protein